MRSQWRCLAKPRGGLLYLGLDLTAWPVVRSAYKAVKPRPPKATQLQQLAVMEREALPLLNG